MEAKYKDAWVYTTSVGNDQGLRGASLPTSSTDRPGECAKDDEGYIDEKSS